MASGRKKVAIVGAGVGGLCAAAILSRSCEVVVFEKDSQPGGKIRQARTGNALIDSGPTVFTMAKVFDRIFRESGASFDSRLAKRRLDVLARHFWTDGSSLDLYTDVDASAAAIAELCGPREAAAYRRFCRKAAKIYDVLEAPFLERDSPDFFNLLIAKDPVSLLALDPYSTLDRALSRQFADKRLVQLFGRYATYCGASPFECPATLMLVAHVEQQGVWLLDGGMQSLIDALEGVSRENGAHFRYAAAVRRVLTDGGVAHGVELDTGESEEFDAVILNVDVDAVADGLFGEDARAAIRPAASKGVRTQSAITFSLKTEAVDFPLSVHNVFFSKDYKAEFDAVFRERRFPDNPTVYVFAPDRLDPAGAEDRLFALVNAPALDGRTAFSEQEIETCRTRTFAQLARFGLRLPPIIGEMSISTPNDFAERFPGSAGALFGRANHGWRASFRRQGARTKTPGLFVSGGAAHPGPGVPMAAISGRNAALAVMKEFALTPA